MENKDLNYWKENAEEDYIGTPISVLRYISELEKYNAPELLEALQEMMENNKARGYENSSDYLQAMQAIKKALK